MIFAICKIPRTVDYDNVESIKVFGEDTTRQLFNENVQSIRILFVPSLCMIKQLRL